jgi:hypothetical protein
MLSVCDEGGPLELRTRPPLRDPQRGRSPAWDIIDHHIVAFA